MHPYAEFTNRDGCCADADPCEGHATLIAEFAPTQRGNGKAMRAVRARASRLAWLKSRLSDNRPDLLADYERVVAHECRRNNTETYTNIHDVGSL